MFRVKDPVKSLHFYKEVLGMTLIAESHHGDFSLYFLAHASQNIMIGEAILLVCYVTHTDAPSLLCQSH